MTLQHVTLEIRPADIDAEVAFWALLGFEHVDTPPGRQAEQRVNQHRERLSSGH